ncbi:MAG: type III-B CRISPR-associated protein Cas10/Cmr2 [Fimbriimonadaceae bacterium]|nr:type III-B CRISPR-associated protein Cas10/Cmr2 [Fimbriimonadaceae bacterium]
MKRVLIRLAFGPVQGFIAAARKTRDLKAGSDLLVEVGRAITAELAREPGAADLAMIFPHATGVKGPNIVQFLIETEDPGALVERCRQAALDHLDTTYTETLGSEKVVDHVLARAQIAAYLEFYAAWADCPTDADYPEALRTVNARFRARKALRDFPVSPSRVPTKGQPRVSLPPKSPLLPEFDTVVAVGGPGYTIEEAVQKRFSLGAREALDGLSLLKRRLGKGVSFPSTRTIAVADTADVEGAADRMATIRRLLRDTDFDLGDAVFGELEPEKGDDRRTLDPSVKKTVEKEVGALRDVLAQDGYALRPYFAVIHADGDSMGAALGALTEPAAHQRFSETLAKGFAGQASERLKLHGGTVVYAGGDDLLALAPLGSALSAAKAARDLFVDAMKEYGMTLSVGIAVGHVSESLQDVVERARRMEGQAKALPDKDALAISVLPRSGGEIVARGRWTGAARDSTRLEAGDLEELALSAVAGAPRGLPYDVRREARELAALDAPEWAVRGAYGRQLERKRLDPKAFPLPAWVTTAGDLARFADLLVIAHFLTRGDSA